MDASDTTNDSDDGTRADEGQRDAPVPVAPAVGLGVQPVPVIATDVEDGADAGRPDPDTLAGGSQEDGSQEEGSQDSEEVDAIKLDRDGDVVG